MTKLINKDELYIRRTVELARLGRGAVSPNPMVGCVIVHQDRIISEGWHKKYGGPHAEVNAIERLQDKHLLPESTVYVNLEPCAHHGKTPPCADLLVKSGVKRVVIANIDANPLVGGKGVKRLEEAGITVTTGILEKEGWELNKRFFTAHLHHRPYIILKWAETSDGFIARKNYDSKWISNASSRMLVHQWRAAEDAIMVGTNTAFYDNPKLNVRDWSGRDPVRVVVDRELRLPRTLNLFDGSQHTLCYNLHQSKAENSHLTEVQLPREHFIDALLSNLYDRNLHSVIVEGGAKLLTFFVEKGLWDEAWVFVAPVKFEEGIEAPKISGLNYVEEIDTDKLLVYKKNSRQSAEAVGKGVLNINDK